MKNKFKRFCENFIWIIFFLIIIIIGTCCLFYTCSTSNIGEVTLYKIDSVEVHIVVFCLLNILIIGFKFIQNKFEYKWIKNEIISKNIFICFGTIAIFWIFCTQIIPKDDQEFILGIANELHHGETERYRNYVGIYNNQMTIITILYFLQYIFGSFNYLAIQALNVFAVILSISSIVKISTLVFEKKIMKMIDVLAILFFLPLDFYITFVYGNLWGLACSLIALLYLFKYLESSRYRDVFITMVCITLGIFIKSNYLIFSVAIFIYLFIDTICKNHLKSFLSIFLILVFYVGSSALLEIGFEKITGVKIAQGSPSVAWIAMGFQESSMAPGWFNGYNGSVMLESKGNPELASKISIENIKESLTNFKKNPEYAFEFFGKKTLSQWANPTFQCFWISTATGVHSNINLSPIISSILSGKINKLLVFYMNIYQSLILEGVLLYLICDRKKIKLKEMIFAVIFIGGFIFHLFWEAKAQYTFTYFVLLIPYAVRGYNSFTNYLLERINKKILRSL